MNTEKRSVDQIFPNQKNPRRHSNKQIEELWKPVKKFGAIRPVVIDENGTILAGHGLYEAYKRNGQTEVDVLVVNGLSEKDKKKLLLADNKIFSMGMDNYSAIEEILQELGQDADFEIPGYDADILEEMYGIKSVEAEAEQTRPLQALTGSGEPVRPVEEVTPHKNVEKAREEAVMEAEKFVICPNCGEKIYL